MMKPIFLITTLFALALPAIAAVPLKAESGKVEFLAVGKPSMLKIKGTGSAPSAKLEVAGQQIKGSVEADLDKLDSGIALRTQHMKEKYLEVQKYPKAVLTLLDAPVDAGFEKTLTDAGENKFRGKLSLHGKEKEVAGTFTSKDGALTAKFPVTLSDFAIDVPKYLGITVADTVDVTVDLNLKK